MKYEHIQIGTFLERPNRFIAHIKIKGKEEIVHVKNTGRCAELLIPGVTVYVQKSDNPKRKTQWDLIGVKKGNRIINMDSQVPNQIVKEWIEAGNLFKGASLIRPEFTYGKSRFDLYIEVGERKILLEVKGVTLEKEDVVLFPDAPTQRGVKHVRGLCEALQDGYESYVFFVVQMDQVHYFTPNDVTHKEFGDALRIAKAAGVHILAYDCHVTEDSIYIQKELPVILENPILYEMTEPLVDWYQKNKRELPWRNHINAYRVWVSEIMLQQTRVEAVKPFYKRFLNALPTVEDLANAKEDELLKLWEGLGYYNRIRNMQKAAKQIVDDYHGVFPDTYEGILSLTGIGNYTAGAIASFAYQLPKPAVDGNVLRVVSRLLASHEDIMKQSVRHKVEQSLEQVIPKDHASDFNQGLIELGAMVCVPNGMAKCEECPLTHICEARKQNIVMELPIKKKSKARRMEQRTIFIFKDGETVGIKKRPNKGLLAGLYELPNVLGHLTIEEAVEYSKQIGLMPVRIELLQPTKHIFSHVEWQMIGYVIRVDELEHACKEEMIFAHPQEVEDIYPIPAAFEGYTKYIHIKLGQDKYTDEI
ncbi:MAG: A/G-specific adenine glycosylase [Lachnospiraceae bacterium]